MKKISFDISKTGDYHWYEGGWKGKYCYEIEDVSVELMGKIKESILRAREVGASTQCNYMYRQQIFDIKRGNSVFKCKYKHGL